MSNEHDELKKLREQVAESFQGVHEALSEVVQGQSALATKVDGMAIRMDEMARDMKAFGADLSGQSVRLTRVENGLRQVDYRLARFMGRSS